jgi:chromosome segregation ATPase
MPEITKKIKILGKSEEKSARVDPPSEMQDLLAEADRLRQTIVTLEADWETVAEENVTLVRQRRELRNRLQRLSQALVNRNRKLKEINQAYVELVRKLKRETEEKSLRNIELEEELGILTNDYQEKVRELVGQVTQREGEVENLRHEAARLRQTVGSLEAARKAFDQIGSELKGQLEESRNRLVKLSRELTNRGRGADMIQSHEEEGVSTHDEIERLWAAYREKLKIVKPTGTGE